MNPQLHCTHSLNRTRSVELYSLGADLQKTPSASPLLFLREGRRALVNSRRYTATAVHFTYRDTASLLRAAIIWQRLMFTKSPLSNGCIRHTIHSWLAEYRGGMDANPASHSEDSGCKPQPWYSGQILRGPIGASKKQKQNSQILLGILNV
jgi:hypothetical protein